MKRFRSLLLTAIVSSLSGTALAHTGHATAGFAAGLVHPFSGLDHLLAMLAVGLWAAQRDPSIRRLWQLPAAFMAALALGAAIGLGGLVLPLTEAGIAASVLALGLLIALAVRLPEAAALALTALFGLLHGYAHGAEMPTAAAPWTYATGFLLATALLHVGGLATGMRARRIVMQTAGSALAVSGAWMLATL